MTHLYLVAGSVGEYEDYREWTVVAYLERGLAEQHCAKANQVVSLYSKPERWQDLEPTFIAAMGAIDPNPLGFECRYHVVEITLRTQVPDADDERS
jgi:hypothetical protein